MTLEVLLVDDDLDQRMIMRAMLEQLNCRVHEAGNVAEATDFLHRQRCDLILADISMPGLSGAALPAHAELIAQSRDESAAPVVLTTAGDCDSRIMLDSGAAYFCHKYNLFSRLPALLESVDIMRS